ncbi:MAG: hypothetical protein ACREQA_19700 [Candidatus Binatia bacterium]
MKTVTLSFVTDEKLAARLSDVTRGACNWVEVHGFQYHGGKLYRGAHVESLMHHWVLLGEKFYFCILTAPEMMHNLGEAETTRVAFMVLTDCYRAEWNKEQEGKQK